MLKNSIMMLMTLILISCSVPFRIYTETDKFNPDIEATYTSQITVKHSNPFDMCEVYLQYVNIKSEKSNKLGFFITYIGKHWAFIGEIKLLIDGKVYKYSPSQSPHRDVGGLLGVTETSQFLIPKEIFEKIQSKGNFDMRISGQKRSFDINENEDLVDKMKIWYTAINKQ